MPVPVPSATAVNLKRPAALSACPTATTMMPNPFLSLIWRSRATARSAAQADRFYDASFSDDELDVFHNHLNDIDYRCLLDPPISATASGSGSQQPHQHRDPRTGLATSHRFTHDFTASGRHRRIQPVGAGRHHQSQLTAHQHQLGLSALRFRHHQQQQQQQPAADAAAADGCHPLPAVVANAHQLRALEMHAACAAQRAAEQAQFAQAARQHFTSTQLARCRHFRPFACAEITAEWRAALAAASAHYAGRWYSLQSALPLDGCAAAAAPGAPAMRLQPEPDNSTAAVAAAGDLPWYSAKGAQSIDRHILQQAAQWEAYRPHWEPPTAPPLPDGDGNRPFCVALSAAVLAQLIDYPANSSASWAVPFEIRRAAAGADRVGCVFDELLPPAELQLRRRNREALRRMVLGRTLRASGAGGDDPVAAEAAAATERDVDLQRPWHLRDWHELCAGGEPEPAPAWRREAYRTVRLQDGAGAEPLLLLVRSWPDAMWPEPEQAVNVSVKCEYQTQFGSEQMTESELIAEWCGLRFNAGSRTERFRMDPESSHILSITSLTLADVEAEMLRLYSLHPDTLLARLHQILRTVRNFPANQYLMRHSTTRPDRTVHILGRVQQPVPAAAANSSSLTTIEQWFAAEAALIAGDHFPWTPIDVLHVSRAHLQSNVMPGMFLPPSRKPTQNDQRTAAAKPLRNDRDAIVARAMHRATQKAAAEQQAQRNATAAKRSRKQRKRTQGRTLKAAATKAEAAAYAQNPYLSRNEQFEEALQRGRNNETINPGVAFDAQGNIIVGQLRTAAVE